MRVGFDNSFLTLLLNKRGASSVPNAAELVDDLIADLDKKKAQVIIPTPTLTEVLLKAPNSAQAYLDKIREFTCFQIKPFDEKSAIELAETLIASIGKKRAKKEVSATKVTFDRQIVAVAKAHGVSVMYSDDKEVRSFAQECGLEAYGFAELKLSPKQQKLLYGEKAGPKASEGNVKKRGSGGEAETEQA